SVARLSDSRIYRFCIEYRNRIFRTGPLVAQASVERNIWDIWEHLCTYTKRRVASCLFHIKNGLIAFISALFSALDQIVCDPVLKCVGRFFGHSKRQKVRGYSL